MTEHRISLMEFKDSTVHISTWWVPEDKFALLTGALGDPDVSSIYSREYISETAEDVLQAGVHNLKEHYEGGTA